MYIFVFFYLMSSLSFIQRFFVSLYCIGEHFSIVHKYVFNVCLYISALNCVVYVTFLFLLGLT